MTRADRATLILSKLKATYPEAHCELNHRNPLELLIATILSAQCTDKRVNIVTVDLFKKYRTAQEYADAPIGELELLVKSTGFYRNKAKNIKACCQQLVDRHKGEVPRTMEELEVLPGVGRKTANVVLGNAFGMNVGVVVDTHVGRLARRFRLTTQEDPVKVEKDLIRLFPQDQWCDLSHLFIWHGRQRCMARHPDCAHCELADLCPSAMGDRQP
ncbi:MAG: endonuclease III [Verrucomicrobiae bacterium]|nr:endonuclease III [Verrucomicrobiae bacterium]